MKRVCQLIVIFAVFANVYSQVLNFGSCPKVEFVNDFDASKYVGQWFEIERYPLIWEIGSKCVFAKYGAGENNTITVYNEMISFFGNKDNITGVAYFDGPTNEAKLTVVFPPILGIERKGSYWVVGTDYNNYSVVWSCTQFSQLHFLSSWVLTRDRNPSEEVLKAAHEVITKNKISTSYYSRTNQDNCPN